MVIESTSGTVAELKSEWASSSAPTCKGVRAPGKNAMQASAPAVHSRSAREARYSSKKAERKAEKNSTAVTCSEMQVGNGDDSNVGRDGKVFKAGSRSNLLPVQRRARACCWAYVGI